MDGHPTDQPAPARRGGFAWRWAKRLGLVVVGLLVLLVVFHVAWSKRAGDDVAAKVAAIRARGEPMLPEDLPPARNVPDDRNAAGPIRAVGEAMRDRQAHPAWLAWTDRPGSRRPPLSPDELAALRAAIAEVAPVIATADEARGRDEVDWGVRFTSPMILVELPRLADVRTVALLWQADALLAHADGRHDRAVARMRDADWLARRLADDDPTLVGHLVTVGVSAVCTSLATTLSPSLTIDDEAAGTARRSDVRALLATLSDEQWLNDSHRRSWQMERMLIYDNYRSTIDGTIWASVGPTRGGLAGMAVKKPGAGTRVMSAIAEPVIMNDLSAVLDHTTGVIAAADAATWEAFKAHRPTALPEAIKRPSGPYLHLLSSIFLPSTERATETHYRTLTHRRLAAVALAVRLYQADHGGRLPPGLDALVPDYLPAVPTDALHGKPLVYKPDVEHPVVYSLGLDGDDDGGGGDPDANWAHRGDPPDGDVIVPLTVRPFSQSQQERN